MPPKTRVRADWIKIPEGHGDTILKRGVGYRAGCDCGWQSRRCKSFRDARAESRTHTATAHAESILA